MATYARITEDGIVAEVIETDGEIKDMFHPDLHWAECPTGTQPGSAYSNGVFSAVIEAPESVAIANAGILAQIAAIESSQGRALRELALGVAGAQPRLTAIDAEISNLRRRLK